MLPRIKKATPHLNFMLTLVFTNGESRIFDVKPYLKKGVFKALADWKLFRQAKVSLGTVTWPNNLDISPDTLYLESITKT